MIIHGNGSSNDYSCKESSNDYLCKGLEMIIHVELEFNQKGRFFLCIWKYISNAAVIGDMGWIQSSGISHHLQQSIRNCLNCK